MTKVKTKWLPSNELISVADPAKIFGLLSIQDLCRISGVPRPTLNYFVRRKLILPILVSEKKKKALFALTAGQVAMSIREMRERGCSLQRIRRRLYRSYGLTKIPKMKE